MELSESVAADICVIGGGPAGSTIANRLASLGHDVCLIESHSFPSTNIGASLPPEILPLLEFIGVRDKVEHAGFMQAKRTVVWWSDSIPTMRQRPAATGFHVDRGQFDDLLLQHAKARGVRILQPAQAMPPERLSGGGWRIRFLHNHAIREVTAKIVVDGSGGRNLLLGRRLRNSEPLLALYAHWRCANGSQIDARVEAGDNEWFWCAPLSSERAVVAVFLDPRRLAASTSEKIETIYYRLLTRFRLFPSCQLDCVISGVKACDASSRYSENVVGPDSVKIGDAGLSLDPLSSQGVQSAIASGLQAAIIVNTLLKYPENTDLAIAFYSARQKEKMRQHAAKTASFYRERLSVCDQPFWRRRAFSADEPNETLFEKRILADRCRIRLSNRIRIDRTPIVKGDVIVSGHALHHDSLTCPVAFLGGAEVVPLLAQIRSGDTVQALTKTWSRHLSTELSYKIVEWLWFRKILVLSDNPSAARNDDLRSTFNFDDSTCNYPDGLTSFSTSRQ